MLNHPLWLVLCQVLSGSILNKAGVRAIRHLIDFLLNSGALISGGDLLYVLNRISRLEAF